MGFSYPIMLDVGQRRCLVIGTGEMAETKAAELVEAGARVVLITSEPTPALLEMEQGGSAELVRRDYRAGDLAGAFLAIAVVDDPQLASSLYAEAEERGVLLNTVDDVPHCHFSAASKIRRGDLLVTLSTAGRAPAFAKKLRRTLELLITDDHGRLVELLARARELALPARRTMSFEQWSHRWERALEDDLLTMVNEGRDEQAVERVVEVLTGPESEGERETAGRVWIVGAGPGSADLITLRGLRALQDADVVIYDRLVDPSLVKGKHAIYAGKSPGMQNVQQELINRQMVELARQGKRVVRLKGGDPYVFGRGGEEAEVLAEAGIDFTVVPAPTSAIAVLGAAGIPVTDRRVASTVVFATGHGGGTRPVDFKAIATAVDTIVVLMGMSHLDLISKELMAGGLADGTPAAIVQEGTKVSQRVLITDLGHLAADAAEAGLAPPAVLVVGEVVRLSRKIAGPDMHSAILRR